MNDGRLTGLGMAPRRNDPNFAQLSAYLPKELVIEVKKFCLDRDINIATAMEEGMRLWVEAQAKKKDK